MREHLQRRAVFKESGGRSFDSDAAFLASIVENSDDAIVSKDLNGVIMSWNHGAEHIFGYSAAEVIGQPVSILIPPDHADEEPLILERIRRGERIRNYETVRCRKDGSRVDVSLTVSPVKDADGRIVGASKIARDIGEQRRVVEQLRQSEERYRVTLASIGDAVISTDNEGRVTFMNAVAEQMTAWRQNEALAIPLDKVFPIVNETTRRSVENPVTRALREGKVVGLANHTILISKDGKERPIDDSAAPIRGHMGDVKGVVLVFRDATEQRVAELTARKLTSIIENSNDAIYTTDLNTVITSWNRGAEIIFGYSAREAIGQSTSFFIPQERAAEEFKILERLRHAERIDHYETVRRQKNGLNVDVSLTVSPIVDADGRAIGISKIARDITQQKRMEKELSIALEILEDRTRNLETTVTERTTRLQQTVGDLETFSYTISHDLRSPLRAMQGFAQALLAEYADKLDAEGQEYLRRISDSAIKMDKLILEVLTYSRIGRSDLRIQPVDLDKLIEEVIQTYPSIRESNAEIIIKHPLHPVLGSHASVAQVVSNLLTNAVKFVSAGAKAKVLIRTENSDSKVRCFFEDNGIGIPQDYLPKIFEPFQRAHLQANYEGTGMGLAIVRKAVERMGGTVGVQSQEGRGSTFWIELPAAEL